MLFTLGQQKSLQWIWQAIDRLGKEMDPLLNDILRDRLEKHLGGYDQTVYDRDSPRNSGQYWHLQQNQQDIGRDNLIWGKYSKH